MQYYLFIGLTLAAIASQVPHVYHAFTQNSQLKNEALKRFQGIVFCGILSIAIFGFVWIEKPLLALAGALIEIIINIYYFTEGFWENGFPNFRGDDKEVKEKRNKSVKEFWRKNWFKIFISFLIPSLIYGFSEILVNL